MQTDTTNARNDGKNNDHVLYFAFRVQSPVKSLKRFPSLCKFYLDIPCILMKSCHYLDCRIVHRLHQK